MRGPGAGLSLRESRCTSPSTPELATEGGLSGIGWGALMALRLLLTRSEAAEALGMSLSHFQRHVQPHLPCVYSGQLRLYRPADLEEWAQDEAHTPAPPERKTAKAPRPHALRPAAPR